jgi:hypothetical protein
VAKSAYGFFITFLVECSNVLLAPTVSHLNKQVQVVLVNKLHRTHHLENAVCKSTQTYTKQEAIGIVKQTDGYLIVLLRTEHLDSNQQEHSHCGSNKRNIPNY